jgi:hypothetical protein
VSSILTHLEGVCWWLRLRLTAARCLACGRRFVWHLPWHSYRCNRAPLDIDVTPRGWAVVERLDTERPPAA